MKSSHTIVLIFHTAAVGSLRSRIWLSRIKSLSLHVSISFVAVTLVYPFLCSQACSTNTVTGLSHTFTILFNIHPWYPYGTFCVLQHSLINWLVYEDNVSHNQSYLLQFWHPDGQFCSRTHHKQLDCQTTSFPNCHLSAVTLIWPFLWPHTFTSNQLNCQWGHTFKLIQISIIIAAFMALIWTFLCSLHLFLAPWDCLWYNILTHLNTCCYRGTHMDFFVPSYIHCG